MGAVKLEKCRAYSSERRKKSGRKLILAYILRSIIFTLFALVVILMVCGVLYIKEHLAHPHDSILPGNMETDDIDFS